VVRLRPRSVAAKALVRFSLERGNGGTGEIVIALKTREPLEHSYAEPGETLVPTDETWSFGSNCYAQAQNVR